MFGYLYSCGFVAPICSNQGIAKFDVLVDVPAAFDTRTRPVVAPAGTCAVRVLAVSTFTLVENTLLNDTLVPGPKFEPVIVTIVPTGPWVGVKLLIVGLRKATTSMRLPLPLCMWRTIRPAEPLLRKFAPL